MSQKGMIRKIRKELLHQTTKTLDILPSHEKIFYSFLILENDILSYSEEKTYDYLLLLFPYFYVSTTFDLQMKEVIYNKVQKIRVSIKNLVLDHEMKEKQAEHYQIFWEVLIKLEIFSLSIGKALDSKYDKSKFELLHYLVFSIKKLEVFKSLIYERPHQVNILDKHGFDLMLEVVDKYLEVLHEHVFVSDKNIDDVIYYDNVLKILLEHEKFRLSIQEIDIIDSKFKKGMTSFSVNERYYYFINKWRLIFAKYKNKKNTQEKVILLKKKTRQDLYYEFQINPDFSVSQQLEAEYLQTTHHFYRRKGMPMIYTVDGEGAKELDDGFSCRKYHDFYRLGIHIADPLYYIDKHSLTFQEASKRATAIYLNKTMIPMYPIGLAQDLFSLNKGCIRPVISFYTDIDLCNHEIIASKIALEQVAVVKNDTYKHCNEVLRTERDNKHYVTTLNNIQDLFPFLEKFSLVDNFYEQIKRSKSNLTFTNRTGNTKSEKMIELLMIFVNNLASKIALREGFPYLYRNHKLDTFYKAELTRFQNILRQEKNNQYYLREINILKSQYPSAFYDITNYGHYGLGLKSYGHLTSPIRRMADDYNLLSFREFYFHKSSDKAMYERENELKEIAQYLNRRNRSLETFIEEYSLCRKK